MAKCDPADQEKSKNKEVVKDFFDTTKDNLQDKFSDDLKDFLIDQFTSTKALKKVLDRFTKVIDTFKDFGTVTSSTNSLEQAASVLALTTTLVAGLIIAAPFIGILSAVPALTALASALAVSAVGLDFVMDFLDQQKDKNNQNNNTDQDNQQPHPGDCPPDDKKDDKLTDPPISPLIVDLDGDGVETISLSGSDTFFDLSQNGFLQRTAWVGSDDGLIVLDRNSNGQIDDIGELFGSGTSNGFSELVELDENGDGVINSADAAFGELRIWRDVNSDGFVQDGELLSLEELGIQSIDALGSELEGVFNNGNPVSHEGVVTFEDSTTSQIQDVWFVNSSQITEFVRPEGFVASAEAERLPELQGRGRVADFSYAATLAWFPIVLFPPTTTLTYSAASRPNCKSARR